MKLGTQCHICVPIRTKLWNRFDLRIVGDFLKFQIWTQSLELQQPRSSLGRQASLFIDGLCMLLNRLNDDGSSRLPELLLLVKSTAGRLH